MKNKLALLGMATSLLLVAGSSRADDDHEAIRVDAVAMAGFAQFDRSASTPSTENGFSLGTELRVHPYSRHGFYGSYTRAGGVFGPDLNVIDTGYSFRPFAAPRLRGLTPSLYLDVGPSLAFVSNGTASHTAVGSRVAATIDVHIWNFMVGAQGSYRSGIPISSGGDPQESVLTMGLRLGAAFDVARLPTAKTETAKR